MRGYIFKEDKNELNAYAILRNLQYTWILVLHSVHFVDKVVKPNRVSKG